MLSRSFQFAKRNIRRTPFQAIAASMVMFLTFFALLSFLAIAAGSQTVLRFYESKPQVIAFFKDGTIEKDVQAISEALSRDPRVVGSKYISKEEALKIYQERNKNEPALLELVTANILPASLEVSTVSPQDLSYVAEILKKEPVVGEVIVPEDVVESLTSATKVIRVVGGAIVLFLILFAILVILMIIGFKIRLKRDEIEIMRLVGATSSFVRAPFILEGMTYGIVGATSSWILIYMLLWYFSPFLGNYLGDVKLLPPDPLFMLSLLGCALVMAVIIGGIGSIMAVRRYLRI